MVKKGGSKWSVSQVVVVGFLVAALLTNYSAILERQWAYSGRQDGIHVFSSSCRLIIPSFRFFALKVKRLN